MKKVLYIATVVQKHINVFHLPFLKMFQNDGYETYVAASNDTDQKNVSIPYCDHYIEINFKRNPLHLGNIGAYFKLKKLINSNKFDVVHCHTPVGGLLGRLAARKARKKGTKVCYTAHGFHFYKGAPLFNWIFYYPVEKICSYFTDVLITINDEDYLLALNHMNAKRVEYMPGVGIDLSRFGNGSINKTQKRKEIGVPENAFLLLSVGEVNKNKNHEIVIKAMAHLNNPSIHYAIAGVGPQKEHLLELADELGVADQVHLLGYRKDIPELNDIADVFCFPSIREGLGLAAVEAMASGIPVIAAENRGTLSFIENGVNGILCPPNSEKAFADEIEKIMVNCEFRNTIVGNANQTVKRFSVERILIDMKKLYI